MAVIDARGFSLVPDISPLAGGVGSFISQKISERLQAKALAGGGGSDAALTKLAARDPRAASQVGSIFQTQRQEDQSTREQQEEKRQQRNEIAGNVAQGFQSAQDKKGFLQAAVSQLQGQFPEIAAEIQDDVDRFDAQPESVLQEYNAALSLFSQQGQQTKSVEQRGFEDLISGFSDEDKVKARKVKARIEAPAGVSAEERIALSKELTALVAQSKGDIAEATEEGKLDAQGRLQPNIDRQRALAKDAAALSTQIFGRIENIEGNIRNMNEGIKLIDEGANVGPIDKWLPSFKATTVKLDNLKNRLGLDVIGSITFGALSAGELKVAFDTAVPPNLNDKELKIWFQERIDKQTKLLSALEEAGIFLAEDGASIPKLMAKRRAERKAAKAGEAPAQGQASEITTQAQFDALPSGAVFTENGQQFRKP